VYNPLKSVFPIISGCTLNVPCFGVPGGFCLASEHLVPSMLTPEEVDKRLADRSITGLRFYDGTTHQGMFNLPKYIREAVSRQTRLIMDTIRFTCISE
jgi:spermidine synthase